MKHQTAALISILPSLLYSGRKWRYVVLLYSCQWSNQVDVKFVRFYNFCQLQVWLLCFFLFLTLFQHFRCNSSLTSVEMQLTMGHTRKQI